MICKNCGMKISDDAKVCPNCGAYVDDSLEYTLLSSDERYDDVYSNDIPKEKKKKKLSPFQNFLIFLLVIVIAGGGSYLYFGVIRPVVNKAPEVSFSSGSGLINRDEKIVYICPSSKKETIEYIQGVSLYDFEKKKASDKGTPISTEYEYTKSIDSTFRAIYFDIADYVKDGKTHTFTFEVKLSFRGSDKIYTYLKTVQVGGDENKDVSDTVFDHSLEYSVE